MIEALFDIVVWEGSSPCGSQVDPFRGNADDAEHPEGHIVVPPD